MKNVVWLLIFILTASCNYKTYKNGYGPEDENPPVVKQPPADQPKPNPVPSQDGQTLFANKCVKCHSEESLAGVSAGDIKTALQRVPAMRLIVVNDAQIASIVSILNSNQNPENPNPGTGDPDGTGDDDDDD
jgi:hypothetical protein